MGRVTPVRSGGILKPAAPNLQARAGRPVAAQCEARTRLRHGLNPLKGPTPASGLDDLVTDGVAHKRRGGGEVKLAHGRGAMRLHGLDAYVQDVGDLLVAVSLGD